MSKTGDNTKIAIVHDELTRRGGAEVVLEEIIRLYPDADIFTLYAGRPLITVDKKQYQVGTTFLQKFPAWFRRHPARLLPLLPHAAEQLDLSAYNLVISSSSAFAKAIITRANVPHLCYCHTPTRYLWDANQEVTNRAPKLLKWPGKMLTHYLRLSDFTAAARVDFFLANSEWTKQRIKTYYRRPSNVVFPPVDTSFFTPAPYTQPQLKKSAPFLCVGRLTPAKHFEQAINVCEKLSLPLTIIGNGPYLRRLRKLAGPYTRIITKVSAKDLRFHYRGARALLQPTAEDFGIAAVEAQACGTPVIAYGLGGANENIRHRSTGLLYDQPTVESLAEAIRSFLEIEDDFQREQMQNQAMRFGTSVFRQNFSEHVNNIIADTALHSV